MDRTIPNAHARAIVASAVDVAIARQAQQASADDLQRQVAAAAAELPTDPAAYPVQLNFDLDTLRMVLATAALERAVDRLTETCVAAQVAHDAQSN